MNPTIKARIEKIKNGEVPEGYKRTKIGIVPNEWSIEPLRTHLIEYRNLSNDIDKFEVYSSSRNGLMSQSEYYNKKTVAQTNLGYKTVPEGYVTYRHMSDDDIFHFNLNQTGKTILVSAEYPVFNTDTHLNIYFLVSYLNNMGRFRYFCRGQKMGGTRTRLYFSNLGDFKLSLPPIAEQQKIAEILATQDKVIELKEKLLKEKQRQKKYLMQQLLTGKKRLLGFSGEWQTVKLSAIATPIKRKVEDKSYEVLSITAGVGFVNQAEKFGKEIAGEQYKQYTLLLRTEFSYNKGNSKKYPQGCIYPLENREKAAVPNVFISFRLNSSVCWYKFYKSLFESGALNKQLFRVINSGVRNDGLLNINSDDFFNCMLVVPEYDEQTAIAQILSTVDKEIEFLKKGIEQEKLKKKTLMQLLLTGIVRVNEVAT